MSGNCKREIFLNDSQKCPPYYCSMAILAMARVLAGIGAADIHVRKEFGLFTERTPIYGNSAGETPMTQKMATTIPTTSRDPYMRLILSFPLRPIRTRGVHQRAKAVLRGLAGKKGSAVRDY